MIKPVIHEAKFVDKADAAINSMVLREIFRHTRTSGDKSRGRRIFRHMPEVWRVRIEDQHEKGEDAPHYILDVGVGDCGENCRGLLYSVAYCDYRSVLEGDDNNTIKNNAILINPGKYLISIWLPDKGYKEKKFNKFAVAINDAYYRAMVATLPNYMILTKKLYYECEIILHL